MITPGRSLVALAAGIGLGGSLTGVVLMHPMGFLAQASARPSTPVAATQPDFTPYYAQLQAMSDLGPGTVLPSDLVLHRGKTAP